MDNAAARHLDELFGQADFDRHLYKLRAANPHLAYELDELARVFRRARDRITAQLALTTETAANAANGPDASA